jgi:hypothetical protein
VLFAAVHESGCGTKRTWSMSLAEGGPLPVFDCKHFVRKVIELARAFPSMSTLAKQRSMRLMPDLAPTLASSSIG